MRRAAAATGLVLLAAVAAHLDYHLGVSDPDYPGFDLAYHWVLGLVIGLAIAWIATRTWQTALPRTLAIALGGLVVAQGIEPLLEGWLILGRWAFPVDGERWRIFFEFVLAGGVGIAIGHGLGRLRPPTRHGRAGPGLSRPGAAPRARA